MHGLSRDFELRFSLAWTSARLCLFPFHTQPKQATQRALKRTSNVTNTIHNMHINRIKRRSRKLKEMGLKIEDKFYMHILQFEGDQFVITIGEGNDDYIRRKLEEHVMRGYQKIREKLIFRYRSFRQNSSQRK